MNKHLEKRRDELAPKYDGTTCSSTRVNGWKKGFDACFREMAPKYDRLIAYLRTCHLSGQAKKDIELIIGETL